MSNFNGDDFIGIYCPACDGEIHARSHIPYHPAISRDIIGPGSRNVATERDRVVEVYYCTKCGQLFDHIVIENKLSARGFSRFGINYERVLKEEKDKMDEEMRKRIADMGIDDELKKLFTNWANGRIKTNEEGTDIS